MQKLLYHISVHIHCNKLYTPGTSCPTPDAAFDLNTPEGTRGVKRPGLSGVSSTCSQGLQTTPLFFLCSVKNGWSVWDVCFCIWLPVLSCSNLCYLNALSPSGHRLLIRDSCCLYRCCGDPLNTSSGTEKIHFCSIIKVISNLLP